MAITPYFWTHSHYLAFRTLFSSLSSSLTQRSFSAFSCWSFVFSWTSYRGPWSCCFFHLHSPSWWSGLSACTTIYQIYTSRPDQNPELQADRYKCLCSTTNWMYNWHLNVFRTELLIQTFFFSTFYFALGYSWISGVHRGSAVKNLPAMPETQETQVYSWSQEDPLEEGMATCMAISSILAWRIPWTEEPRGLQSIGSQRSDWARIAN